MLLTVDIGNSQVSIVLFDGERRVDGWRLPTDARRTADEYGVLVRGLLDAAGHDSAEIDGAVISSVVPRLTNVFDVVARRISGSPPLVVRPGTTTGLPVRYEPPSSLGPDRVADAVGAVARFGAPVIVVDLGTATTFNVVNAAGTFVGGAIAPGVAVMAEALVRSGARLHEVDLVSGPGDRLLGRGTEEAIRLGVLHGHAGLVQGMVGRMERELQALHRGSNSSPASAQSAVPVVATGGWSRVIAPLVPRIDHVVPDLLVEGLRKIYELDRDPDPKRRAA